MVQQEKPPRHFMGGLRMLQRAVAMRDCPLKVDGTVYTQGYPGPVAAW